MTKIYPMPKIEFPGKEFVRCLCYIFELHDTIHVYIESSDDIALLEELQIKENQTFEQAVTEWVRQWVINNFEPIELPLTNMFEEYEYTHELLELNPNAIRISE